MVAKSGPRDEQSETEGEWRQSFASLDDIRTEIDRLDAVIVPLLCQRHRMVTSAAKFKPSVAGVVVPARVEQIISRVRDLASSAGVNPDTIETVYRALIDAFTRDEQKRWRDLHQ